MRLTKAMKHGRFPAFTKRPGFIMALAAAVAVGACEQKHFQPPNRAAQVAEAQMLYSQKLFDSVTWASDSVRSFQGNEVYAEKCRRCHGTVGEAGTQYAKDRGLKVPSLVRPDWKYESLDSLRKMVFTGHSGGMPIYGVAGISPREIDAVAYYVLYTLRPDVLGAAGEPGKAK
ncbi:MAG: cytochrome c [Gemmatimonadetes bacterium]|nr:cytochrome c [Gemmatimonadota bacterium]